MIPEAAPPTPPDDVRYVIEPLHRVRGWLKFLAVLSFLGGTLYAITVIGLVFAWLPIVAGVFLWQASDALERAYADGSSASARTAITKLKSLFFLYGIVGAIGLALLVLALVLGFGAVLLDAADPRR